MKSLKDMVSGGKRVRFSRYRRGEFIYVTECGFEFSVPLQDIDDAEINADEKASMFMKWLRKALKSIENESGN